MNDFERPSVLRVTPQEVCQNGAAWQQFWRVGQRVGVGVDSLLVGWSCWWTLASENLDWNWLYLCRRVRTKFRRFQTSRRVTYKRCNDLRSSIAHATQLRDRVLVLIVNNFWTAIILMESVYGQLKGIRLRGIKRWHHFRSATTPNGQNWKYIGRVTFLAIWKRCALGQSSLWTAYRKSHVAYLIRTSDLNSVWIRVRLESDSVTSSPVKACMEYDL
jgi:hypothetical protein